MESFSTPPSRKTSLIEERVINGLPKNGENGIKMKKNKCKFCQSCTSYGCIYFKQISVTDGVKLKHSNNSNAKVEPCVDKRLKKVFLEQSLITVEDLNRVNYIFYY